MVTFIKSSFRRMIVWLYNKTNAGNCPPRPKVIFLNELSTDREGDNQPLGKNVIASLIKKTTVLSGHEMRYYETCSVSAMPVKDSLLHGVVVTVYSVPDPHKGDPRRSLGGERVICRLENGRLIDRYISEYKRADDGVLEFWN